MKITMVLLMAVFPGAGLHTGDSWRQCSTDYWLKYVGVPGASNQPVQEAVLVAYTLPTGCITALPYGLDPARLPADRVIRAASSDSQQEIGAPLFIAANVLLDKDYSYDAASYCMFSVTETIGRLSLAEPNLVTEDNRESNWRSFIEVVTVELVATSNGPISTRSRLQWVEVLGVVPFVYDPNEFQEPPERQLWDPEHESDRAFHIAWQGMMRWPFGEGLTIRADGPESRPYSATRCQGTQDAALRFPVPDPQTWRRWNPPKADKGDNQPERAGADASSPPNSRGPLNREE